MSATENTATGSEVRADEKGSKKGRFMVKFAVGRFDSESAEITKPPATPREPLFSNGKLQTVKKIITRLQRVVRQYLPKSFNRRKYMLLNNVDKNFK